MAERLEDVTEAAFPATLENPARRTHASAGLARNGMPPHAEVRDEDLAATEPRHTLPGWQILSVQEDRRFSINWEKPGTMHKLHFQWRITTKYIAKLSHKWKYQLAKPFSQKRKCFSGRCSAPPWPALCSHIALLHLINLI